MFRFILLSLITTSLQAALNSQRTFDKYLNKYNSCFILYSVNENKIVEKYETNSQCSKRIASDSTFKVALSLMAYDSKIITNNSKFKWDGRKGIIPEHEKDQTPISWLRHSVVWVSQQITPQLGIDKISSYLDKFSYGNKDFSGDKNLNNGLTHAWLSSSLKISAMEQIVFLTKLLKLELPTSKYAMQNTIENMHLQPLNDEFSLHGKTGAGRHGRNERLKNPSKLRDAWFVGFVKSKNEDYVFVSNFTDKKVLAHLEPDGSLQPFGSQILKPITLKLLNEYFSTHYTHIT